MYISIDGTIPTARPRSIEIVRDLLDRDGTNAAIEAGLLTYRIQFPIAEVCEYEQIYNLATVGTHTVRVPREDDFLTQEYQGAQVRITRKTYDNGQMTGLDLEIIVFQAPL